MQQLQLLWMTKLLEATSVRRTLSPGRCPSTLDTTSVAALSLMTSGSSLLLIVGKSLYQILLFNHTFKKSVWRSTIIFWFCILFSPFSQIAILGDNHIWEYEGTEQYMSVDAIYWHESYDYTTLDFDIMLMKLAHPVTLNQYVKPVPLPKACPTPGDMCTVSGWGNIYSDEGEIYPILAVKDIKKAPI